VDPIFHTLRVKAMIEEGFKKRGVLFAPEDSFEEDPVVLKNAMGYRN